MQGTGPAADPAALRRRVVGRSALDRLLDGFTPPSGAVVMGTGIVSLSLLLDGRETLSRVFLALGVAVWIVLGVTLPTRARRDPARFRRDRAAPASLTAVAATGVLGTRFAFLGWSWAAVAMLAIASVLWIGLLGFVLRGWTTPTVGASFMVTVATESLAVLAASLALTENAEWLLGIAIPAFALGLVLYVVVLRTFDPRQLATGRGDHWITGGALAISTIAGAEIARAAERHDALGGAAGLLEDAAVGLWVLTIAWLPVLIVAELRHPRGYDLLRWSTVFPVGMCAACSFAVGTTAGIPAITDFARVWAWVAVAVWAAAAIGLVRTAARAVGCARLPP